MSAEQNITWTVAAGTFTFRAAAIIISGGSVLLCDVDGVDHLFLPGGRVQFGETAREALERELDEEFGHRMSVGDLRVTTENLYGYGERMQHEVAFYFHVAWPDGLELGDVNAVAEAGHTFRWVPLSELDVVGFQPEALIEALRDVSSMPHHMVLDRRQY